MFRFIIVSIALLLLVQGRILAKSYRWVDDDGNVSYSQSPPRDDRDVKLIKAPPPPPAGEAEKAKKSTEEQQLGFEQRQKNRADDARKAETEEEVAALQKQECDKANKNISTIESRPPDAIFKLSSGEYKRFTAEEREAKLKKYKKYLKGNCK